MKHLVASMLSVALLGVGGDELRVRPMPGGPHPLPRLNLSALPRLEPTLVTSSASSVATTTVTLNGTLNPNKRVSTGWFRYSTTNPGTCDDSFGTRAPTSGGTSLEGDTAQGFSQAVTGLSQATTYYFCAIGSNTVGLGYGSVATFRTTGVPSSVTTSAPSSVAGTSFTAEGAAIPNGLTTTGFFRYHSSNPGTCADSGGTRAPSSGGASLGTGTTSQAFNQSITGLTPGTTYYLCALATNSAGTGVGSVVTQATTAVLPVVTTSAASSVTSTTMTLNGSANPGGGSSTGWFRYYSSDPATCADSGGTRAPSSGGSSLGSGNSPVSFNQGITGLTPGTSYYLCAFSSNSIGTGVGSVVTQATSASAPTTTTSAASSVTSTTATLNGSATPNGATATGWFRYYTSDPTTCTDSGGTRAPSSGGTSLGSGSSPVSFNQGLTGLTYGTQYWVCAFASNSAGTGAGTTATMTTLAATPTVSVSASSSITDTTMTINGSGTPNGASSTGWFRYYTSSPGTCTDSGGTRAPSSGGTSLGSGLSPVAFSENLTGLTIGTTYYICAFSSNSVGTGVSSVTSATASPSELYFLYPAQVYSECQNSTGFYTANTGNVLTGGGNSAWCQRSSGTLVQMTASNRPRVQCRTNVTSTTGSDCYVVKEETRSNQVLQSEVLGTTWGGTNTSVTSNTTVAPDGNTTADTVSSTAAGSAHFQTRTVTSTNVGCLSGWVGSVSGTATNSFGWHAGAVTHSSCSCWKEVSPGHWQTDASIARISSLSGECDCAVTRGTTLARYAACGTLNSSTTTMYPQIIPGDAVTAGSYSGVYWGMHLQPGVSVPGSYVRTTSSTATVFSDQILFTSTMAFDNTPSFAVTVEFPSSISLSDIMFLHDNVSPDYWSLTRDSSARASAQTVNNGSGGSAATLTSPTMASVATQYRLAVWRTGTTLSVSLDGTAATSTVASPPDATNYYVTLGNSYSSSSGTDIKFLSKICGDNDSTRCR